MNVELEHSTEVGQLYDRHGHDYYHLYSVRSLPSCVESFTDWISLSIQQIFWQQMIVDLHVTYNQLNQSMSVNFVGLAMGCVLFIPPAKKYGRRPIYIVSTALMLVTSFWTSRLESLAELYICNLLQGLAGATNEAIAEITVCCLLELALGRLSDVSQIADLFFVHHRGTMNALYMIMVMIGVRCTHKHVLWDWCSVYIDHVHRAS